MFLPDAAMLESLESSILPVDEAQPLPPILYTSPEYFEFEREAIFAREWLCVGRVDEIPNKGDYFASGLANDAAMTVLRTSDGGPITANY